MQVRKVHRFTTAETPTKALTVYEDELGWLYIAKLPFDQDNIWPNIEMIEQFVGMKLVPYDVKETW